MCSNQHRYALKLITKYIILILKKLYCVRTAINVDAQLNPIYEQSTTVYAQPNAVYAQPNAVYAQPNAA